MGLVDQQQDSLRAAVALGQVLQDCQPQLAFVHAAIGLCKMEKDGLEQCPPTAQMSPGKQHNAERILELLAQHQAEQRFPGA